MWVSGFTFIRNAQKFDYPIVESITSILPLCHEVVVAVGNSDDNTRSLIESIDSEKIKIIDTIWDDTLRTGGRVLAAETMKALNATNPHATWCLYIQGDEVLHEQYIPALKEAMERYADDDKVEGLLFDYLHFYGSYDYVANSRRWYRKEVRVIRRNKGIYSFRDAQGFQVMGRPLRVKSANATIHHYGWVKPPDKQQLKQQHFHKMWHTDDWVSQHVAPTELFDYSKIDSLTVFSGTHPRVILQRIQRVNWHFDFDISYQNLSFKHRIYQCIEKLTGWKVAEYRNYRLIK